jgi:membrane-bound ClpP family serine protease
MCKNRREISTWFAILYIAGCLLLSLDAFQNNMNFIFLLNLSCLLMALLVLVKKSRR